MSSYTTELRYICENAAGKSESVGYNSTEEVITKAVPFIFDFDFPLYDSTHRNMLCCKILMHYYTQEIAYETYGLWKFNLRRKMLEIMPYYNKLYEAAEMLKPAEMFDTKNIKRERRTETESSDTNSGTTTTATTDRGTNTRTDNLTSTANTNATSSATSSTTGETSSTTSGTATTTDSKRGDDTTYTSDTPQGALTDLTKGKYMTSGTVNKTVSSDDSESTTSSENTDTTTSETTSSGSDRAQTTTTNKGTVTTTDAKTGSSETSTSNTATASGTATETETVKGYDGSRIPAEMVTAYIDTIINVDMQIIDNLQDLFISIW